MNHYFVGMYLGNVDMLSICGSNGVLDIPLFVTLFSYISQFLFSCRYLKNRKVTCNLLLKIMKYLTLLFSTHRFCMQMKSQTVGQKVQMQKLHQLSQCVPIQRDQNGETRILHCMILYYCRLQIEWHKCQNWQNENQKKKIQ